MMFAALAALALAGLAALGRWPLKQRRQWRALAYGLAVAAASAGLYVALRGGWLDGLILIAAGAWLIASEPRRPAPETSMGLTEARAMLGVSESAGREEIESAYRRLIQRVHPDLGGAPGLAAQLNAARQTLLRAAR